MKLLIEALVKAQKSFKQLEKDKVNHFQKNPYSSIGAINMSCRAALADNGLCLTQPIVYEEGVTFVRTILAHVSGEQVVSDFPIPSFSELAAANKNSTSNNLIQAKGALISYARRYALQALLNLSPDEKLEDDGVFLEGVNLNDHENKFKREIIKLVGEDKKLLEYIEDALAKKYKYNSLDEIDEQIYKNLKTFIENHHKMKAVA